MTRLSRYRRGIATLALFAVVALSTGPVSGAEPDHRDDAQDAPGTMAAALSAQVHATTVLLDEEGVVGTGIGIGADGAPRVMVLLVSVSDAELVPKVIDGVATDTLVVGELAALPCPGGATSDCSAPIPAGISVGHPAITAGTLGAYVQNQQGDYFALSNNHIFAAENTASIGDIVLQPGPGDGGSASNPSHLLGTLFAYEPISFCHQVLGCGFGATNSIDAAIAAVDAEAVQAENFCGWTPQSTTVTESSLVLNVTQLKKCGRTTGATSGIVRVVNATVDVQMNQGVARFTGQIVTDYMSAGGDSGSLMVNQQNKPTALLFAGSDSATVGIPINNVLDRFDVTIVDSDPTQLPPPNEEPVASFTVSCTELSCSVDASGSSDPDGSIVSYEWSFGDGATGSGVTTSHSYASGGARTVTLTVTDNDGATDTTNRIANPTEPPPPTTGAAVGMVDPSQGLWTMPSTDGAVLGIQGAGTAFFFGNPDDFPIVGDWDCDGDETPGMYRRSDGYVYLRNSNTQGIADVRFFFGNPGDVPIAGDWNGDGCDTVSIYRPSEARFYVINELGANDGGLGAAAVSFLFGNTGDKPVVGDWDGDGIDEVGLHRETTGFFYWRNTLTTGVADGDIFFGDPGDRFVAGDWGVIDGRDTPAVFRPSNLTVYFRHTLTEGVADSSTTWPNATPDWLPIAGHFGLG
jgi:hypothetical protein